MTEQCDGATDEAAPMQTALGRGACQQNLALPWSGDTVSRHRCHPLERIHKQEQQQADLLGDGSGAVRGMFGAISVSAVLGEALGGGAGCHCRLTPFVKNNMVAFV